MNISTHNNLNESIFNINNCHNEELRGIVHSPITPNGIGLVLIPAGTKYRVGAHNINVKLARRLVQSGYTILRSDTEGLGYSDGEHYKGYTVDAWREVQSGKQVNDALFLVEAFKTEYGLSKIVLGGICGAAVTAQYTARVIPKIIDGILAINPMIIEIQKAGASMQTSSATTKKDFYQYLEKIGDIRSWMRLFLGKSDFSLVFSTIIAAFKLKMLRRPAPVGVNQAYWDGLLAATSKQIKVLFIFSGKDATWYDFLSYIQPMIEKNNAHKLHTIVEIKDANHELHFERWQQTAFTTINRWLDESMLGTKGSS